MWHLGNSIQCRPWESVGVVRKTSWVVSMRDVSYSDESKWRVDSIFSQAQDYHHINWSFFRHGSGGCEMLTPLHVRVASWALQFHLYPELRDGVNALIIACASYVLLSLPLRHAHHTLSVLSYSMCKTCPITQHRVWRALVGLCGSRSSRLSHWPTTPGI